MKKFLFIIYEHWLATLSIFLLSVVAWFKNIFWLVFFYSIKIWQLLVITSIFIIFYFIFKSLRSEEKDLEIVKPKNKVSDYGLKELFSLNWRVWLGCGDNFSDRYIWADGPFCPKCDYELDLHDKCFFCISCDKKYKLSNKIFKNIRNKAIKIFEVKARNSKEFVVIEE